MTDKPYKEPKVVAFPTIDRIQFYRKHYQRSADSVRELMVDLVQVQDRLYAELIEMENSLLELLEEQQRVQRLTSNNTKKEVQDAD